MSRRHMLSRRCLLQSAGAITAARKGVTADGCRTSEDLVAAEEAVAGARDLMAPVLESDKAEMMIERINDLKLPADIHQLR
jgi:hypothetical protein